MAFESNRKSQIRKSLMGGQRTETDTNDTSFVSKLKFNVSRQSLKPNADFVGFNDLEK